MTWLSLICMDPPSGMSRRSATPSTVSSRQKSTKVDDFAASPLMRTVFRPWKSSHSGSPLRLPGGVDANHGARSASSRASRAASNASATITAPTSSIAALTSATEVPAGTVGSEVGPELGRELGRGVDRPSVRGTGVMAAMVRQPSLRSLGAS